MFPKINHQAKPIDCVLSNDGSFATFTYAQGPGYSDESDIIITNLKTGNLAIFVPDSQTAVFCPDNTHVLVAKKGNEVLVINARTETTLHKFTCADVPFIVQHGDQTWNRISLHKDDGRIKITDCFNVHAYHTITQSGNSFVHEKHVTPLPCSDDDPIVSNTGKFIAIARRPKIPGAQEIVLKKHESDEEIVLLQNIYTSRSKVIFCGDHDEYLIAAATDAHNHKIYIIRADDGNNTKILNGKNLCISPNKKSFLFEEADQISENKIMLYILPLAADILAQESGSYFSLLPKDLRLQLRDYTT